MANAYLEFYYNNIAKNITSSYELPLTIISDDDNNSIRIQNLRESPYRLKYSYNYGLTWYSFSIQTNATYNLATLDKDGVVMIVADPLLSSTVYTNLSGLKIVSSSTFSIRGNIMSLMSSKYATMTSYSGTASFDGIFSGSHVSDASKLLLVKNNLSATYTSMFENCAYLKAAPALPDTTLYANIYNSMFKGCIRLINAPALPATTLANNCYYEMFRGCTALKEAPELPATTLASSCYAAMFKGCTSLVSAPALPATTLAQRCYYEMFNGCTSLNAPPALPATTLAQYCYAHMFANCTSLHRAPDLLSVTTQQGCYFGMFERCTSLSYIRCLAKDITFTGETPDLYQTTNWVYNVASTGTFVSARGLSGSSNWPIDSINGVPIGWTLIVDGSEDPDKYRVSVTIDPSNAATVLGSGWYSDGATCTLSIYENNPAFRFIGWYEDETAVSYEETYSFEVTQNTNITAQFEPITIPSNHSLYVSESTSLPAEDDYYIKATFSKYTDIFTNGRYYSIDSVSYFRIPEGYEADAWYVSRASISGGVTTWSEWEEAEYIEGNESVYIGEVTSDVAVFCVYSSQVSQTYDLTVSISPASSGTISLNNSYTTSGGVISSTYTGGSTATITATPSIGYEFDYWLVDNVRGSSNATMSIVMNDDHDITAIFKTAQINEDNEYFAIIASSDNTYIGINIYPNEDFDLQYRINNGDWNSLACTNHTNYTSELSICTLSHAGDKVRLRAKRGIRETLTSSVLPSSNNTRQEMAGGSVFGNVTGKRFNVSSSYSVSGNILSLYYYDDTNSASNNYYYKSSIINPYLDDPLNRTNFVDHYVFHYMFFKDTKLTDATGLTFGNCIAGTATFAQMFQGCTNLVSMPNKVNILSGDRNHCKDALLGYDEYTEDYELPISGSCSHMFRNCTSLTTARGLTCTLLAEGMYMYMFYGCTSLVNAPALPATNAVGTCYMQMFEGCTNLVTPPALPATIAGHMCYAYMFYGCTSLATAPALPATTLASNCYYSMFYGCTSLATAPALPATTLASGCYSSMFANCTSLTTAPALPATTLASGCYWAMFGNCTSLATAPALPATTLASNCYNSMFSQCTSLVTAPVLPAEQLLSYCYAGMFSQCSSLNYIKCMATGYENIYCTRGWVYGVSNTGTFVKRAGYTIFATGEDGIPEGWTVEEASS